MANLILKTAESEVKQDKNGRNYKTVTFTEAKTVKTPFGEMIVPANQCRATKKNQYELNYLEQEDIAFNAPIFNAKNPQAGGWFLGGIETRNVPEYEIPSDGVRNASYPTTYTTVVFGDTDSPSYNALVKSAFKSAGHEIIEAVSEHSIVAESVAQTADLVTA